MNLEEVIKKVNEAVIEGDADAAREAARIAVIDLKLGEPIRIVREGIQPAMDKIGIDYENGEAYLPNLILVGDAAIAALEMILPFLQGDEAGIRGVVVLGTVYGDMHDIGKNILSAILTANGFKVIDLGVNVQAKEYIEAAEREGADIIALSTLLTTCLPYQRDLVNLLKDSGKRNKFFVICGGGPVTPEWVRSINADGYGREAPDAVKLCTRLLSGGLVPPLEEPIIEGALKIG